MAVAERERAAILTAPQNQEQHYSCGDERKGCEREPHHRIPVAQWTPHVRGDLQAYQTRTVEQARRLPARCAPPTRSWAEASGLEAPL